MEGTQCVADWKDFPRLAALYSADNAESFEAWGRTYRILWAQGIPVARSALMVTGLESNCEEIVARSMISFHRRIVLSETDVGNRDTPEEVWLYGVYGEIFHRVILVFLRREPWSDHSTAFAAVSDGNSYMTVEERVAAIAELNPVERDAIKEKSQGSSTLKIAANCGQTQNSILYRIFGGLEKFGLSSACAGANYSRAPKDNFSAFLLKRLRIHMPRSIPVTRMFADSK